MGLGPVWGRVPFVTYWSREIETTVGIYFGAEPIGRAVATRAGYMHRHSAHSTARHSTAQRSAAQHSTTQGPVWARVPFGRGCHLGLGLMAFALALPQIISPSCRL